MSPSQKLIIVTPVANDLYPPYLSYYSGSNHEISSRSNNTSFAYKHLFEGDLALSKNYSSKLLGGAHKDYFAAHGHALKRLRLASLF